MAATRMDGVAVAGAVKERVAAAVADLRGRGVSPCLATVLVGDDAASATYVRNKHRACEAAGILTRDHRLPASTTQAELDSVVDALNSEAAVHGILVQLPLPQQIDEFSSTSRILPPKDVDGLTPYSAGMLAVRRPVLAPCTPSGIIEMLDHYEIKVPGRRVAIINRSNLIGKPLSQMLLARDATVTVCHSRTREIARHTRDADIVVSAVGDRSRFELKPDMVAEGAVVIDAAIQRHEGRLAGDADYGSMSERASHLTPVPGGVGPMTVAMLLKNTVTAASMISNVGA